MPIQMGSITFDPDYTAARESVEEVGGRDARVVEMTGLVVDLPSSADVEARFDAIADAVSVEDYATSLSLRPGRRLWVRRASWQHEIAMKDPAGSFKLRLEARDPLEESEDEASVVWSLTGSTASLALSSTGTVPAPARITLVPDGEMQRPSFGDGERTIRYEGSVPDGATLEFDGPLSRVLLDGVDVTPYTEGLFPLIAPEGTTLMFQADPAGSATAEAVVAWRNLWW
ncbi:MAG: hypothetical protein GY851_07210 [bacterium]|nr:hypothetical protein [bacterium]